MRICYKVADIENLKSELELLPETAPETRQSGLRDAMKVLAPVLREDPVAERGHVMTGGLA